MLCLRLTGLGGYDGCRSSGAPTRMQQVPRVNPFSAALAMLIASVAFTASPVLAQTWTGAGPNDNWSTGANWGGGVPPASSSTTSVGFDSGSPRLSPIVDAPWTINRLRLGNFRGGVSYTLAGQEITFDGANPGIFLTFSSLTMSNPIVLAAPASFSFCFGNTLTISGPISGPGSLHLSGRPSGSNPSTTLSGASTYTGGTSVSDITLDLRGSILGPLFVGTSNFFTPCSGRGTGILTGNGTVAGPVRVAGTGTTIADFIPDLVMSTGNLTLDGGSRLFITINGPVQGSQYAALNVTGTVTIWPTAASAVTGATLHLLGSYTPVPGDVFTIITNDGTDPVI